MFEFTFCLAAAFVLYTLGGYPLLLAALARMRPRPFTRAPIRPTVSILLPVYNGEPWLRSKLESILALDYPRELLQILVISDGSTDRTGEIASQFESSGVQLIHIPHSGKAAALNAGLERATGEILFLHRCPPAARPLRLGSAVWWSASRIPRSAPPAES
jgi:biofilm PGA synthesis N-glycosyltransferase PgaC